MKVEAELPLNVAFAAAYLDGVMEGELPEIAKQWRTVREYLTGLTSVGPRAASPTPATSRGEK